MNVLLIPSDNSKSSGAFLSMVQLAKLLRDNYDCNVYVMVQRKGNGSELLMSNGIPVFYNRAYNWVISIGEKRTFAFRVQKLAKEALNWIAIKKLNIWLKRNNIDIVHLNTSWTYIGAVSAHQCNIPVVWHIREFLEEDQHDEIWDKKYGYRLMSDSSKIIAISKSIYNKYVNILPKDKLSIIYNGIDSVRFYREKHVILNAENVNILITGTISESKGQIQIIKACRCLVDSHVENFTLHIVGIGSEEYTNKLQALVKKLELTDKVVFHGFCGNTEQYYEKSDITCVCSKAEAFGRVTIEVMLSGTLVIGAACGATEELIQNNKTGLLYEYGNENDLTNKIKWAVTNKEIARSIANCGRTYAKENMTAVINAQNVYSLYQEVMEKKNENKN